MLSSPSTVADRPGPGTCSGQPAHRRCWTVTAPGGAIDVEVTARDDDSLGAVLAGLGRVLGVEVTGLWAGSDPLPADLPLTASELAHGAVLGLNRPGPRAPVRSSALELHIVGGPEAGRTFRLGQGRHVLGRGAEATVALCDPDISRQHVQIDVGAGEISVRDLGSTNGSRLDAVEVGPSPCRWTAGAVLRIGASALQIRGPRGPSAVLEAGTGGRRRLRQSPRLRGAEPEVAIAFPAPPTPPPRRRLAWVAVALPAVGGVLMAWAFHAPHFLFFALLSPVVAVGTWLSDRWSGRRSGRRDGEAYAVALAAAQTRLATAVAAAVRSADAAHPDLAALTTAARRRTSELWTRRRHDGDALQVRLGSAAAATLVLRVQTDGVRVAEPAEHLPVLVDLAATGGLTVVGPRALTIEAMAGVLAQLAALHAPGEIDLVPLLAADRLPDWAWTRWLPHLAGAALSSAPRGAPGSAPSTGMPGAPAGGSSAGADPTDERLLSWLRGVVAGRRAAVGDQHRGARPGAHGWLILLIDRPLAAPVSTALAAAREYGVLTLAVADSAERLPVLVDAVLELTGETGDRGTLRRQGAAEVAALLVDRMPLATAAMLARDLAGLRPASAAGGLPRQVRLLDLPTAGIRPAPDATTVGSWSSARDALLATLGRTAEGTADIDLCAQGPHALVAGTTGAGKSELLQTLVTSLAMRHPPDRCSFLLVDYKGGAAFAEAATLPHTVGLVTDLDTQSTGRALRSLHAELTRREALLARHGAPSLAQLPDTVDLARLVIVVDEFAALAEELPAFVPGLVGIAQRGRSLGVHLVLATQRPAGVVSPEIRANCSLRICLRTTDDVDSRDVLGTAQAAHLPVDRPGRAYLRTGNSTPVLLQVARVATSGADTERPGTLPVVRRWHWPQPTSPGHVEPGGPEPVSDLALVVSALRRRAAELDCPAPHRPWLAPLPDLLDVTALGAGEHGGGHPPAPPARLMIGLVDRPDAQLQEPLEVDLDTGGGWLAAGGPRSGRTTLLRTVLGEAVHRLAPGQLHVHVLDHGGGRLAAEAAAWPHTGTTVGRGDPLRTVRLLDRLAGEVAVRRAGSGDAPRLLLLVDGVESVITQLDDYQPAGGAGALLQLVRDGAAAGLSCVLTADRAVPGGRLAAAVSHRLLLPWPDRADYAVAGIAARAVPAHRPPGRALLGEDALECQLARPRSPLRPATDPAGAGGGRPPVRIPELPADPVLPRPARQAVGGSASPSMWLAVGPGGDEGDVLEMDLLRSGGLLIAGPPGSGRSSALQAFATHLSCAGHPVLRLAPRGALSGGGAAGVLPGPWLGPTEVDALRSWVDALAGQPAAVLADDLGALTDTPVVEALTTLCRPSGQLVLVLAGSPGELSAGYRGPVTGLRRSRSGLLLHPGPGDADLLGVRLPRTPVPSRPGSGWLVRDGTPQRVQVARRRGS